jgi:hypothetical protein
MKTQVEVTIYRENGKWNIRFPMPRWLHDELASGGLTVDVNEPNVGFDFGIPPPKHKDARDTLFITLTQADK